MSGRSTPFDKLVVFTFKSRGGNSAPGGSTLAQKVAPLGLKPTALGDDIAKKIKAHDGVKCITRISVQHKKANIEVVPTTSQSLKDIVREKGSLSKEDIKTVAKIMDEKLRSKTYKGKIMQVIGTCVSLGESIDGVKAKEMARLVREGEVSFE